MRSQGRAFRQVRVKSQPLHASSTHRICIPTNSQLLVGADQPPLVTKETPNGADRDPSPLHRILHLTTSSTTIATPRTTMSTFTTMLPPGVKPGQRMSVTSPCGQQCTFFTPPNAAPGMLVPLPLPPPVVVQPVVASGVAPGQWHDGRPVVVHRTVIVQPRPIVPVGLVAGAVLGGVHRAHHRHHHNHHHNNHHHHPHQLLHEKVRLLRPPGRLVAGAVTGAVIGGLLGGRGGKGGKGMCRGGGMGGKGGKGFRRPF